MDEDRGKLAALGIEMDATMKRFCGEAGLLVEMLRAFAEEDLLERLPAAAAARDGAAVERVAHAVKGTSANLGFAELSERCDKVVKAARAGELDDIEELGAEALGCYRAVRAGIAAL